MFTRGLCAHAGLCAYAGAVSLRGDRRCLQVVAASMTPSMRDLVVWARVAAQEGDPHSFAFFSAHVSHGQ